VLQFPNRIILLQLPEAKDTLLNLRRICDVRDLSLWALSSIDLPALAVAFSGLQTNRKQKDRELPGERAWHAECTNDPN